MGSIDFETMMMILGFINIIILLSILSLFFYTDHMLNKISKLLLARGIEGLSKLKGFFFKPRYEKWLIANQDVLNSDELLLFNKYRVLTKYSKILTFFMFVVFIFGCFLTS